MPVGQDRRTKVQANFAAIDAGVFPFEIRPVVLKSGRAGPMTQEETQEKALMNDGGRLPCSRAAKKRNLPESGFPGGAANFLRFR
jgi:hypothetical protein